MGFFKAWGTKKHGMHLDHPVTDDGRCRNCDGACCRSFPTINISWEEYQTLSALGAVRLELSLTGQCSLIIEDGCEFLIAGRCTIYEHRPDICRRFFCSD